jgi:hypothetical protein
MNAAEFRQAISGSSLGSVTSFDTPRPYTQVTETLRLKATECLAVSTTKSGMVSQGNMRVRETLNSVYKPTVSVTGQEMELAVQVDFGKTIPRRPEGGIYILVADAIPAGANATKVTIYRGKLGQGKEIGSAIRDWAEGTSSTCPNLIS